MRPRCETCRLRCFITIHYQKHYGVKSKSINIVNYVTRISPTYLKNSFGMETVIEKLYLKQPRLHSKWSTINVSIQVCWKVLMRAFAAVAITPVYPNIKLTEIWRFSVGKINLIISKFSKEIHYH